MYNEINQRYAQYLASTAPRYDGTIKSVAGKHTRALIAKAFKEGTDPSTLVSEAYAQNRLWVWSDMHFNHANIQEYAQRPTESLQAMENRMLDQYRRLISPSDVVIFGGDVSMGRSEQIAACFTKIKALPGTKVLVRGNHDQSTMTQLTEVFDYVCAAFTFNTEHGLIDCTHYPMPTLPGRRALHGHTHQHLISTNHINMSVEHTHYAPVKLLELALAQQAWFTSGSAAQQP